jgi:hypothetical protein
MSTRLGTRRLDLWGAAQYSATRGVPSKLFVTAHPAVDCPPHVPIYPPVGTEVATSVRGPGCRPPADAPNRRSSAWLARSAGGRQPLRDPARSFVWPPADAGWAGIGGRGGVERWAGLSPPGGRAELAIFGVASQVRRGSAPPTGSGMITRVAAGGGMVRWGRVVAPRRTRRIGDLRRGRPGPPGVGNPYRIRRGHSCGGGGGWRSGGDWFVSRRESTFVAHESSLSVFLCYTDRTVRPYALRRRKEYP